MSNSESLTTVHVSGLELDTGDINAVIDRLIEWTRGDVMHLVVTPNVDHFLRWNRDSDFRELYELASMRTIDGAPLALLARIETGRGDVRRITGVDLFSAAAREMARLGVPVSIVGGAPGVAAQALDRLEREIPGFLRGVADCPSAADLRDDDYVATLGSSLSAVGPHMVGLCLGSPKQEDLFRRLKDSGVAPAGAYLGVGAAVDFIAGSVARAPAWIQGLGAEWLYRLAQEPGRLWRRYLVDDAAFAPILVRAAITRIRGGMQ